MSMVKSWRGDGGKRTLVKDDGLVKDSRPLREMKLSSICRSPGLLRTETALEPFRASNIES